MDYTILLVSAMAIFLGFFIQTITGFSGPLILIILLFVFNIKEANGLAAIFFTLFSLIHIIKHWRFIDYKVVRKLSLGIIIGLLIGTYMLMYYNPIVLKKILGFFIILYVFYSFYQTKKIKIFQKLGFLFGLISGIIGGLFSAAGPPIVIYIHNKLKEKEMIRGTIIGAIAVVNFVRLPPLIYLKIINLELLMFSLYLLPVFFLALFVGQSMFKRINLKVFNAIILILLFVSGLVLVVR